MKLNFLRDLIKDETIVIIYCKSEDEVIDIFTKSLKLELLMKRRRLLGVCIQEDLVWRRVCYCETEC